MASATSLLTADPAAAQQVEEALQVLHSADARLPRADAYLAHVRSSPVAWPACAALIRSPTVSSAALMFAASTVHARIRADWPAFDDAHRAVAFALAVEGLRRPRFQASDASALHSLGRAAGFAVSMAAPVVREAMWAQLGAALAHDAVLSCAAFAAVVHEVDSAATADVERHVMVRGFCKAKAGDVVTPAVRVLGEGLTMHAVAELRAAVQCIQAWHKYAAREQVTPVLVNTIRIEQLSHDVAETLTEMLGYTGSNMILLKEACDGLMTSYHAVQGSEVEAVVHHAIAEVACALSDGSADELMEQEDERSRFVVQSAADLLWLCLKSRGEPAFCAAVEGWSSWVSAANLVRHAHGRIIEDRVAAVVSVVVQRMKSLAFISDFLESDGCLPSEGTDERISVTDLLLEATSAMGVTEYLIAVAPFLQEPWNSSPSGFCAGLLAFSVAGDDGADGLADSEEAQGLALSALGRIMDFLESYTQESSRMSKEAAGVRRAALTALCSFAPLLGSHASDMDFYRALRCAGVGMLDSEVSEKAAEFLCELAVANNGRLGRYLEELIVSGTAAVPRMSMKSADYCVRGLSRIVGDLSSYDDRLKAMDRILEGPCRHLVWVCGKKGEAEDERNTCRALELISSGIHEVNDNETAAQIFGRLRPSVFEIAVEHCANGTVSKAVCRLFEVCVLPTLMDDDQPEAGKIGFVENGADDRRARASDSVRDREQGERQILAMSCMSLAAECFRRSGKYGEVCWLQSIRDMAPHVLECLEGGFTAEVEGRALACLSMSLRHSVDSVRKFCGDRFDSQSDMSVVYLRLATTLLRQAGADSPVAQNARACAEVGLACLQCGDVRVVREALAWWKAALARTTDSAAPHLLAAAGGPEAAGRGFVCAARNVRCAGAAADALLALGRGVADAGGGEQAAVVRACLAAGFGGSAAQGIDGRVREMLLRSCIDSADSKRDLSRALKEFGRVCAAAM